MFGRKLAQQTHRQQLVSELGHSAVHLRRAAGHLAMGTAEHLTPTYDRARQMADQGWNSTQETLKPLYQQMRENATNARAMKQQGQRQMKKQMKHMKAKAKEHGRWRGLSGLLIAGAAVGAATAAVARRRRAQQAEWEEYEPMTGYDESRYAESQYAQKPPSAKVASGAANMADTFSSRAGRIADSLHERSATMQERAAQDMESEGGTGSHAAPSGMPPRTVGPSGDFAGPPAGSTMGGPGMPTAANRDRLGDPALDFPDER